MKLIPQTREVDRALNSVRAAVKEALKGLNQATTKAMAKGDYAEAEALATKGPAFRQFQVEVDGMRKRWRELRRVSAGSSPKATTPLWQYYQPILKALVKAGGECLRSDLEAHVKPLLGTIPPSAGLESASALDEHWRAMVRRAKKHLISEGWIEDRKGIWKITEAGRRTAEKTFEHSEHKEE